MNRRTSALASFVAALLVGCSPPTDVPDGGSSTAGGGASGGTVTGGGGGAGGSAGGGEPVAGPAGLSYAMAAATYTAGVAITPNTAMSTGGAIAAFGVQPALPSGLSLNSVTGEITGTPARPAPAQTFVVTGRNAAGTVSTELRLTVIEAPPVMLTYQPSTLGCVVGVPCSLGVPTSAGGRVTSFSVTPTLPAGLQLQTGSGAIAGLPTERAAATQYTVTATNSGGSTTASVSVTVLAPPTGLNYRDVVASYFVGRAITPNVVNATGGTPTSFAVTPSLPAGLSLNSTTGGITGTPTAVTPAASYSVTATNADGSISTTLELAVTHVPPAQLRYATSVLACVRNAPCTLAAPTQTGGPVTTFVVTPSLPGGLSLDAATGAIAGTAPAAAAAAPYLVRATNSGGFATVTLTISVVAPAAPSAVLYSPSSVDCRRNVACTIAAPSWVGGAPTSYTISPTLPPGLVLNADGSISGTATSPLTSTIFTVTGTNGLGSGTGTISLRVLPQPPFDVQYSVATLSCTRGSPCGVGAPTASGDPITSLSISPGLPSGMTFDTSTGAISGTPTIARASQSYTITANNGGGQGTALLTVAVTDQAPAGLAYSPSTVICPRGNPCSVPAPTSTGGVVVSYSISPPLPPGLSINSNTGSISGQANTLSATQSHTVTATNSGGSTTATLTLSVADLAPAGLTYAALGCQVGVFCNTSPSSTGGVPTSYSITPTPPAWVTFTPSSGAISGTPPATASAQSFTVTATNPGGSTTAQVTIVAYNPPATLPSIATNFPFNEFKGIGIHPTNPLEIYAVSLTGRVYRSNDGGQSWQFQCSYSGSGVGPENGNVLVSPTGAAFVNTTGSSGIRVTNTGGPCTQLNRSLNAVYETDTWFAFTSTGRVWNWNTSDLSFSDDDGTSWTTSPSSGALWRSLAIDPFDDARLLSVHQQWTSGSPQGVTLGGSQSLATQYQNYNEPPIFDPAHQGFVVLRMTGTWSANGGTTWATTGDHAVMAIDSTGAGYRVSGNALFRTPNISVATPVWTSLRTFNSSSGERTVKVSGNTVVVLVDRQVHVSVDRATTFTQVVLNEALGAFPMQSLVASGSTLALGFGLGVAVSTDDAASWAVTAIAPPSSGSFGASMRLHQVPASPQRMFIRSDYVFGSSNELVTTSNGFATSSRSTSTSGAWFARSAFALSQANADLGFSLGGSFAAKTINGGATWTFVSVTAPPLSWSSWLPSMVSEVSPWSSDQVFYVENQAQRLYVYDHQAGTNVDVTSRLPFTDPAALEVVARGGAMYSLRVISRDGKVAESSNGVNFTTINAVGGLPQSSSYGRLLKSARQDPSLLITATFLGGSQVAVSFDGGRSWVSFPGFCINNESVRDVAVSNSMFLAACNNQPVRILRMP